MFYKSTYKGYNNNNPAESVNNKVKSMYKILERTDYCQMPEILKKHHMNSKSKVNL